MHDKTNDEETKNQINNDINEYFDLSSLDLDDINQPISEIQLDKENNQEE